MGLSVLDWECECCGGQFNPAMQIAGLGDGDPYPKDEKKVCRVCSMPEHKFPCNKKYGPLRLMEGI